MQPSSTRARTGRWPLLALSAGLALLVVAPLLAPGTVLVQDMVFVPEQPWRTAWLGVATSLPRAVPADALVSALTQVLPGELLQKAVLLLALAGAALGAARLVPSDLLLARAAAAVAYAWNPYVAERLLLGQWTLLVAHATLPWVLRAALDVRAARPAAVPRTLLPLAVASITATGGLLALAVAAAGAGWSRRTAALLAAGGALQLPWVVPSLLAAPGGGSDPAGVELFAARAESWGGTLLSLLGLGGVWNAAAVPASRTTALAPLLTLALLALVAAGLPLLVRRWGRPAAGSVVGLAGLSLLVAAAGATPGLDALLRAAVEHVPGAGLLRDGQKWLPPLALLYALGLGLCVERLAARPARRGLAVLALLLPVAALPDLAWGAAGRLEPVRWPADWAAVAQALEQDPRGGDVLSLPFAAYRSFDWNDPRRSLDPAPRWLDRDVVVDDRLLVGDRVVEGEDPRSRRVRAALAAGTPLGRAGIGWVLVAGDAETGTVLQGAEPVHRGPDLELWRLPDVQEVPVRTPSLAAVLVGDALALGVLVASAGLVLRRRTSVAGRARP